MKFTVLGSSGFIGKHLVAHLLASGHEVFGPIRNDPAVFEKPLDHVIYCVGLTADFRQRPFDTVRAHVCYLADLLEKANFESFLFLSSTRVYAGAASGDEHASLIAGDLYNLSKLTAESLCFASGRNAVRVARLSNVVGAADIGSDNFLFALAREALAGRIVLRVDPASAKDYIHVGDVVQMLPKIAAAGKAPIYNLASGRQVSHGEWVSKLANLTGCQVDTVADAPLVTFPEVVVTRLREDFGFMPRSVFDVLPCLLDF